MRDTDRDLTSVVVVRRDSEVTSLAQLDGRVVATGAVDSPQATLLPLALLAGVDVVVRRFDVGVGLHGDHIGGEREAARALAAGEVDAACMIDANHLLFSREGILPANGTRIIAQTRALRPLQHDRRRPTVSAARAVRVAPRWAWTTPILPSVPSSTWRASPGGCRDGCRATGSSRRPSTGSASTTPGRRDDG